MKFSEVAREAEFLKRYKRFFADVRIGDETLVAHVPNTGSLKTCLFEGAPCIITESADPKRKLKATLQFLKTPEGWVGVNTALPNLLAFEAWEAKRLWTEYAFARREYKISKESRLDLVFARTPEEFERGENLHFVEIKNVTYAQGGVASFPDAVTERGRKHLHELMRLKREGHTSEILFVVQREGCERFRPADEIDAAYGEVLREAKKQGVEVRALACHIDPLSGVTLTATPLALEL